MIFSIIIVAIIIVGVLFGVKRFISVKDSGCCDSGEAIKEIKAADNDESHYTYKTLLKVEDMFCDHCKKTVTNVLNSEKDTLAKVDLAKKEVTLFTKQPPNIRHYQQLLSNKGYPARIIK